MTDKSGSTMKYSPVFVLGAPRSSTSAMQAVLTSVLGYSGKAEGWVFPLLGRLVDCVDGYDSYMQRSFGDLFNVTLYSKLREQKLKEQLFDLFKAFHSDEFNRQPWSDKTPDREMITCVPMLKELFPGAFFIFMKRRGIDNVLSAQRKFEISVNTASDWWAQAMQAWSEVREQVADCCCEIDSFDMRSDCKNAMQPLVEKLDLSHETHVKIVEFLGGHDLETTRRDCSQVSLNDTGWTEREKGYFVRVCGQAMSDYGYHLDLESGLSPAEQVKREQPVQHAVLENIANSYTCVDTTAEFGNHMILHANEVGVAPAAVVYPCVELKGRSLSFTVSLDLESTEPFLLMIWKKSAGECNEAWKLLAVNRITAGDQRVTLQFEDSESQVALRLENVLPPGSVNNNYSAMNFHDFRWSE